MSPVNLSPTAKAALILPLGLLSATLIVILVQLLFGTLLGLPSFGALSPVVQEAAFLLFCFGILAAVALAGMALFGQRLPVSGRAAPDAAAGAGLGVAALGTAVALAMIAGATVPGAGSETGVLLLSLGLVITLVQAGAEEIFFRGWMQPALQEGWGRWPGLLAASAAFSGLHFVVGEFDPLSLVNGFLAGLWFGLLLDRSGSILLPIGAHFGWNASEEMLFGVAPNPGAGNFGTLFDWDLAGSPLWGGSEAGLNASLPATFTLLALIAATASWGKRPSPSFRPG